MEESMELTTVYVTCAHVVWEKTNDLDVENEVSVTEPFTSSHS